MSVLKYYIIKFYNPIKIYYDLFCCKTRNPFPFVMVAFLECMASLVTQDCQVVTAGTTVKEPEANRVNQRKTGPQGPPGPKGPPGVKGNDGAQGKTRSSGSTRPKRIPWFIKTGKSASATTLMMVMIVKTAVWSR